MKAIGIHSIDDIVKQLPQPVAFINKEFDLVATSKAWLAFFGNPGYEADNNTPLRFWDSKENTLWEKQLRNCFKGGKEFGIHSSTDQLGKERWLKWTALPWFDETEDIIGAIVSIEDIGPQLEQEAKYEKLEALLREQSEITRVGIWEYHLSSDRLIWSEMTRQIHEVPTDYEPQLDTAINFYKQGHSRNTIAMLVHNGIQRGTHWNTKLQIISAKGNEKWVIAAGKPLYKNGEITRLVGTLQDVTEQVAQEIKTKESEQLLRTLIDNLPLNVFIKDLDSRKILVNKSESEYLGVDDPQKLLGKSDFDLYDKNVAQISRDEDLQVMKTKRSILGKRTINVKKDGSSTSFLTSKIPWLNLEGESKGVIGISIDITDIIQKEDQLRDLINVTAIQNKKLINFAHIVSHNLRSHTANFSMLLDFLIREKEETEKERILKMLNKASENLSQTLENLNEVVDISTNVNLEKKSLHLSDEITKVQENLAAFLRQHKAKIVNTISDKVYVKAVPAYLESILLNLLTNAVKYKHSERTPEITMNTRKVKGYIVFNIQDNGLGIDMSKYGNQLFGMYKTFHNNKDARGIGLYITKNQIEAMGGNIMACSELNKGSTFSVYFKDED
ncbi:MAG: PAS domain-containing protein [Bacteroidota bacterium]